MKISLKLLLYTYKKYSDGTHPIILQYIINRKVKRKVIYKCQLDDWDAKNCRIKPKVKGAAFANNFISEKFAEAEKDLFAIQTGTVRRDELFQEKETLTLKTILDKEYIRLEKEMKAGSYNKLKGFEVQLKGYSDINHINLSEMDLSWFKGLARYFMSLGNNGATTQKKIKTVRAMLVRYSREAIPSNVAAFKIAEQKPVKQKLTAEELKQLEDLHLIDGDLITAVRDLFLLQVYLRGIRVGDLLQAHSESFKNGYFTYVDDKTNQSFSIKLIGKAQSIVDKYSGKHERLFPFFKWKADKKLTQFANKQRRMKEKETCTAVVNKYLRILAGMAGINKPLSSHIARHTFARMAIDKINNPMVTMELLGHSSLAIHQQYLNDVRKDDMLDKATDDIFS